MRFDILTIFPAMFDSYLNESLLKRARQKGLVEIAVHNLRDYATDKHHTTDDAPYGGGPGMVMKVEPIAKAVEHLSLRAPHQRAGGGRGNLAAEVQGMRLLSVAGAFAPLGLTRQKDLPFVGPSAAPKPSVLARLRGVYPERNRRARNGRRAKRRIILFSAKGKQFDAKMARRLAKYDQLILICGRYEGVDERVAQYIVDEEVSLGPYVLTGGELPAMVVVDAVARHIPGVLGKNESLEEKRYGMGVPVYTRPEIFRLIGKAYRVPKVLLSGDHKKIEEFRGRRKRVSADECGGQ